MKKISFILLLFVLFPLYIFSQSVKVQIVVNTFNLPDSSSVYITGNNEKLGDWNPAGTMLTQKDKNTWIGNFSFEKGTEIDFKITLGSWEKERLNNDGSTPANTKFIAFNDTTIAFDVKNWSDRIKGVKVNHGQITGKVEYIDSLKADGILPRNIIIWLPPGYEKNKKEKYPVLYMHDGQNIIDPTTSSFGYDWRVDEVADSLIKAGKVKPLIIVGIYCTSERSLDYGGSKDSLYMNFVVNKLKPLIDKKYRTLSGRKNTATTGSSLGGLISFLLAWNYPDIFSKAACLSPAFHIREYNCLPLVEKSKREKKLKIYIGIGGIGLEERLQPGVDEMLKLLKEKGYVEGKDLEYFKDPTGEHNEQSWAKEIGRVLEYFF